MASIADILQKYCKLTDFCARFWSTVSDKYPMDIACHEGCGICCELQSVSIIEAFSIWQTISSKGLIAANPSGQSCVFLDNDKCSIYAARPVICRTHGLAIKSKEFVSDFSITCPYNFSGSESIPPDAILDVDLITQNLVRLNYAFCMQINKKQLASERIKLSDIANHNLDPEIQTAFENAL
jgi:hypothetical protein